MIAQDIQKSALSRSFPNHDAFKMFANMIPARVVGGDFYDFFFTDRNHFCVVAADVSGKGMPAALYMMKAQTLIKNIIKEKHDLGEALYQINNELYEGNDSCMFVSAFIAVTDIFSGLMEYINAGHTHPLINEGSGYHYLRPEKNIVLGVRKNFNFKAESMMLSKGSRLFLYTDGVTEAENEQSNFFGEERLLEALSGSLSSPDDTLERVYKKIQEYAGDAPQSDDITMLEFCFEGMNGGSLTIDAKNENLVHVINFLKQDMSRLGVYPDVQFKVVSAAEEIFANIADYAYPQTPDGQAELITNMVDNTYMVAFIDSGQKYNPLTRKDPKVTGELSKRPIGGLGIYIAKILSDEIEYFYDNNHNILRIKFINKAELSN